MCQKMDRRGFLVDVLFLRRHLTGLFLLRRAGVAGSIFFSSSATLALSQPAWSATSPADAVPGAIDWPDEEEAEVLLEGLKRIGIEFSVFEPLWWAAFMRDQTRDFESGSEADTATNLRTKHVLRPQSLEFLRGFSALVFRSSTQLQEELGLVSRLLSSTWGRFLVMGRGTALAQLEPQQTRALLDDMAQSSLDFRRKIHQGLVIFMGMSQMSRESFAKETGFPGTPLHVLEIWRSSKAPDGLVREKEQP